MYCFYLCMHACMYVCMYVDPQCSCEMFSYPYMHACM